MQYLYNLSNPELEDKLNDRLSFQRFVGLGMNSEVPALTEAVALFEREDHRIKPADCRANAMRFAPERFRKEFSALVEQSWAAFQSDIKKSYA